MNKVILSLLMVLFSTHVSLAAVLILQNGYYIDNATILRNLSGKIVYEKEDQIHEIDSKLITSVAKVVPHEGRPLTMQELANPTEVIGKFTPKDSSLPRRRLNYKCSFWGHEFYIDNKKIRSREIKALLENNPEANNLYDSGQKTATGSTVLSSVGGFCVGWPLGQALAGNPQPSWLLAVIGGVLLIPGIALESLAGDKFKQAFEIYNQQSSDTNESPWRLSGSGDKIAIIYGY